jgi:hypothetical protein
MQHISKHFKLGFLEPRTADDIDSDPSIEFCCSDIAAGLCDPRTAIKYEPRFREYWLEASKSMTILYCPWCAHRLVKDLRDKFFVILKEEYQITATIEDVWWNNIKFPEEFYTDQWWKKRGL